MKLFLAVKRPNMTHFAQHGLPVIVESLEEFLNLPEVAKVIYFYAPRFGDKWMVKEWSDDINIPQKTIHPGNS